MRKAVQFSRRRPAQPAWFYYFGPFRRDERSGLLLPLYFTAHDGLPKDEESRQKTGRFRGRLLEVAVNEDIDDEQLKPPGQ